jgi:hypothetical protein
MKRYTQKELREMVRLNMAHDITQYDFDQMAAFLKSHNLEKIGYSRGLYGVNGCLLRDIETGEYYASTARNCATTMAL